jgi:hypothetical protein
MCRCSRQAAAALTSDTCKPSKDRWSSLLPDLRFRSGVRLVSGLGLGVRLGCIWASQCGPPCVIKTALDRHGAETDLLSNPPHSIILPFPLLLNICAAFDTLISTDVSFPLPIFFFPLTSSAPRLISYVELCSGMPLLCPARPG